MPKIVFASFATNVLQMSQVGVQTQKFSSVTLALFYILILFDRDCDELNMLNSNYPP